jgi:hypothetical protein
LAEKIEPQIKTDVTSSEDEIQKDHRSKQMGGVQGKALGFGDDANLDTALTKRDLQNWMEHKQKAKFGGIIPAWVGGAFAAAIFLLIVPILAFVIIIWQRGNP